MWDLKKMAQSGACQICKHGCIASYDCGHDGKEDLHLGLYGKNTVCPLAKYDCKPDGARKHPGFSWTIEPTQDELFALCYECEHSRTTDTATKYSYDNEGCFETHCIDCPVYMTQERLYEAMAEAAMI